MIAKSTAANSVQQDAFPAAQTSRPRATLPDEGFIRLPQVLAVIPVSKSTWWDGVRSGKYPKSVKLGPKLTAWRVEDIRALIAGATVAANAGKL